MYSFASFFIFVFIGPFVGAAFLGGSLDAAQMVAGLLLGLMFFPITLFAGFLPALGTWLLATCLSQLLRLTLMADKPHWLVIHPEHPKIARLRNPVAQLLVGTGLGGASGLLLFLVTHGMTLRSHGPGVSLGYLYSTAGLVCGLVSAALAASRTKHYENPDNE